MRKKSLVREYLEAIIIAVLMALLIRTFVVQAFKIPSGSMIPTLLVGDHILVNKFIYGLKIPNRIPFTSIKILPDIRLFRWYEPQRGDIIVFQYPQDERRDFIKRVIGLPGDSVQLLNRQVYVNGKSLREPYALYGDGVPQLGATSARGNFGPVTVPPGNLFVMGDNRDNSLDSRFWGFLDEREVKGKAFMIYWSWDQENGGVRWRRFGQLLR